MFGSDLLKTALSVTAVTDLLDSVSGVKALIDGRFLPSAFTTVDATINFYLIGQFNASLEWDEYTYSIACRDKTDYESRTIAQAVLDTLNRADGTDCHFNCTVLGTIPPVDDTDNYNTPVEVIIKVRG